MSRFTTLLLSLGVIFAILQVDVAAIVLGILAGVNEILFFIATRTTDE